MNLDGLLIEHRLFIDSQYEELAGLFCNLTGQRTSLTKDRFLLSNWYEGYLYTLLLGIRKNQREMYKGKRLDKAPKWSNNYIKQYKYALSLVLSRKDILNELNLIDYPSINLNERDMENILDDVKKICDEFSNGGLLYLSRLYEKDNTIFNDFDGLEKIMRNAIEKKT
jgi:hypothetical protein